MDQDDRVLRTVLSDGLEGIVPRLLPGLATGDDPPGLADPIAPQQLDKVIAVLGEDRDGDRVNVLMRIEVLQSVNDDWLAVDLEELLRHGPRAHADAYATGEDDGHV